MEHVVFVQKSNEEKYHTKLANMYLDAIVPHLPESYGRGEKPPEPGTEPGILGASRKGASCHVTL